MVTFDEFKKLEIKVAKIKEVKDHPNADKLYIIIIELDYGTKQVVAGIKNSYKKEDLTGRQVIIVNNLEPVLLRGVESQAMILAASDDKGISIIVPDREVKIGSAVK